MNNQKTYKLKQVLIKRFGFFVTSFFLLACVFDNNIHSSKFDISINMEVSNDDKIQLFYIPKGDSIYRDENLVAHKINASDNPNEVIFSLPLIPEKFRIDLGEEKIETPIKINEITLKAFDKVIVIDGSAVNRFFKPNIYLLETNQKNIFLRQNFNNIYDPFMESTPLLHKKIELEIIR